MKKETKKTKERKKKKWQTDKLITKFYLKPFWFEIHGGALTYILFVKSGEGAVGASHTWYYPDIDFLFLDLWKFLVRGRLATGRNITFEEIVEIVRKTKGEILEIMKPFEELKPKRGVKVFQDRSCERFGGTY